MVAINREINIKTLAALKRVYDAQFEMYKYALSHDIPIGDAGDTFIRRTLSELADTSEKILSHISLVVHDDSMYMYIHTALTSVQKSLSVLNRLKDIEENTRCGMNREPLNKLAVYAEKLETAIAETNKTVAILKSRLEEGY